MRSEEKKVAFIADMLAKAYSERSLKPYEKNIKKGKRGYEYFLASKLRTDNCAEKLKADPLNRELLCKLKQELITYKILYKVYRQRVKNKNNKIKKRYLVKIRMFTPEEIIRLIAEAEYAQYNEFFRHHSTIARINPTKLLKDKREVLDRFRGETLMDFFRTAHSAIEIRLEIEESLLENPKELYPAARAMKRKFIIHSGMTNTGKTYNAVRALKKSATGVYLGPLRLLAMEIQEELLMDDVMCNMKTGEEESIVPFATHVSSTVEMADLYTIYDTAVIDECQMIASRDRGSAWTRAILGVCADEIHLCTAPEAVKILIRIIEDCGDDYEVIQYDRRTPIEYDGSLFTGAEIIWEDETGKPRKPTYTERLRAIDLDRLEYGDALIAFNRKDVLAIADILNRRGIRASVIYGALPYASRKYQLERFMKRKTKVVVATDAIGMGLNLPIRRIIFTTPYKYDGKTYRLLESEEIKQIAGRAGRKGIYDVGYVYSVAEENHIKASLTENIRPIDKAYIDFDTSFIEMNSDMSEILSAWMEADMPHDMYEKVNVTTVLTNIKHIERLCEKMDYQCDKETMYRLATITFDERDGAVFGAWIDYVGDYLSGKTELPYPRISNSSVEKLESSFKKADLYFAFCKAMGYPPDNYWIENTKAYIAEEINYRLTKQVTL